MAGSSQDKPAMTVGMISSEPKMLQTSDVLKSLARTNLFRAARFLYSLPR